MQLGQLGEITIFLAVVDAGSFVAGGQSTGITRSAASKAIVRLEDRLGVRLINRTTRALSLTDEGRVFYERAMVVAAALEEAYAGVSERVGTPRGVLRLTVPDTFGRRVILPLLNAFLAAWPDVQAEVSFSDRPSDLVEEGFDLALRIDASDVDSRLVSRIIARYERVLVASPGYLAARGEPEHVDDLVDHEALLFLSKGRRQVWRLGMDDRTLAKAPVKGRLRLDSGEALRAAAVAGAGIALLPIFLVSDELAAGTLRRVLPQAAASHVEISAIYPSKRLLEPRVRKFIDFIAQALSG